MSKRRSPEQLAIIEHVHSVFVDEVARQGAGRTDFVSPATRTSVNNATIRRVGIDNWQLFMNDWHATTRVRGAREANRARAKVGQARQA